MQQLNALHSKFPFAANPTRAILLNTYIKFYNMYDVCYVTPSHPYYNTSSAGQELPSSRRLTPSASRALHEWE